MARPKRKLSWRVLLFAFAVAVAAMIVLVYGTWAAFFHMDGVEKMPERSAVFDMDGRLYSRLQGENRIKVPLNRVSLPFIRALLAREDTRFYKHPGFDVFGIARALVRNVAQMGIREGGSTITQQLARNSFQLGGQTLHRKILEAFVALRMERNFSKDEILEHYVNRIYFGSGMWGVETASLAYFGKHAADLNLSEAAMLVGIIRSPNRFSPFNDLKAANAQRDTVLDRMAELDMITEAQANAAKKRRVRIAQRRPFPAQENYAMDAVRRDLDLILTDTHIKEGGLRIYTTIDARLQKIASTAVEQRLREVESTAGYPHPKKAGFSAEAREREDPTNYLQGSVVVIDNRTGGLRALVGGRDYFESKYNRALLAKRQVGSTFKPFVYAAAFSNGTLPGAAIDDSPIRAGELRTASNWSPQNADGKYKGILPAAEGLIQSRNTMSVRLGDRAGIGEVKKTAAHVGLQEMPGSAAIFLGAFEATLKDLTAAYSIFPNYGLRKQPYIIERIDDEYGNVIYRAAHLQSAVLDSGICWLINDVLVKVIDRGTAARARSLGFKAVAAGKTGTTNDYHDAWFIGYTTSLTCGVWVGLDQPATIMARGYGATLALPIWTQVMRSAPEQKYPAERFRSPVPLEEVRICSSTSKLATTGCSQSETSYEIELPVTLIPQEVCGVHRGAIARRGAYRPRGSEGVFRAFRRLFGGR